MPKAETFKTITDIAEKFKNFARRRVSLAPLDALEEPFRGALTSLYRGEPQLGDGGQIYKMEYMGTKISPQEGRWLYDLCCKIQPEATLEVGLAYGFSMLFIMAALKKNGRGKHTAIDPFPWQGIAYAKAAEVGMPLEAIKETSERAAVDLVRAGRKFDVIFIDGNHRFDSALIDFSLLSHTCKEGGYIIMDDMWMKSIRTVSSFVRRNRGDFEHIPTSVHNIAVFKKVAEDKRPWNHFVRF